MIDLIGTPRYPLGHPGLRRVFRPGDGKRIDNENLAALVRTMHVRRPFEAGMCYTNVARLRTDAETNGFRGLVPFGGWMLLSSSDSKEPVPVHHAWVVLGGDCVIDLSMLFRDHELRDAIYNEWWTKQPAPGTPEVRQWNIDWRKARIEATRPFYGLDPVEHRVWGVVPEGSIYIGCPCDPKQSVELFRKWHARYGKIDGYDGPGVKSLTQKIEESMYGGKEGTGLGGRL